MTLYIDLDDVLTAFTTAASPFIGATPFISDTHMFLDDGKEWDAIVAGAAPDFWSHMAWEPDGKQLWAAVMHLDPFILSAPAKRMPTSGPDKIVWCIRELGIPATRVVLASHAEKQRWATTDGMPNVLIDDYPRNIQQWRDAGGIGVLHRSGKLNQTLSRLYELRLYAGVVRLCPMCHEPTSTITDLFCDECGVMLARQIVKILKPYHLTCSVTNAVSWAIAKLKEVTT